MGKVQELIQEGYIRRVRLIHREEGIPPTLDIPAAAIIVLAVPVMAALAGIAILITE